MDATVQELRKELVDYVKFPTVVGDKISCFSFYLFHLQYSSLPFC